MSSSAMALGAFCNFARNFSSNRSNTILAVAPHFPQPRPKSEPVKKKVRAEADEETTPELGEERIEDEDEIAEGDGDAEEEPMEVA
jgi:hypothetical protein